MLKYQKRAIIAAYPDRNNNCLQCIFRITFHRSKPDSTVCSHVCFCRWTHLYTSRHTQYLKQW